MDKKNTLKKQKNLESLTSFDPNKDLKDLRPEDILETLIFCIEHADYDAFREVASSYLEFHNKTKIAENMGVSRRALYHMLSKDANPTIKNIMNFYQAIKKVA